MLRRRCIYAFICLKLYLYEEELDFINRLRRPVIWGVAIACTGLLVGKKASTDGSVMISYAADSHSLYGEMYRWPAATWPKGAMFEVKEWDTGKPLGKIAQVENTYSVVGNMNEHQVAITESTFGGRH